MLAGGLEWIILNVLCSDLITFVSAEQGWARGETAEEQLDY